MLNINVGLLGHVDSGKTALAKALSQTASTAAFDKSPQSQSRGITLDLGFSACEVNPLTPGCAEALAAAGLERVTCTIVDCPGHASLIRTVVGGAQIIDVMILLVDATKGFQQQTAECLVLGEVLAKPLVVVINKVDAVQGGSAAERAAALARLRKKLAATFARTRWPRVPMVEVAAAPRSGAPASVQSGEEADASSVGAPCNTDAVLPAVLAVVDLARLQQQRRCGDGNSDESRAEQQRFMMLVDHCFAVRGQGTVFTGTVLGGLVRVGDSVLLPKLQETRKVKSLQVFHQAVTQARTGDRVGLCVGQFDATLMERGVLCAAPTGTSSSGAASATGGGTAAATGGGGGTGGGPVVLEQTDAIIARVHRIRFHPLPCDSHTKFHVTVGHTTAMATMRFFSRPTTATSNSSNRDDGDTSGFDPKAESTYEEELSEDACMTFATIATPGATPLQPGQPAPAAPAARAWFAVVLLETPVFVALGATLVAMRLDVERENFCRIAISGRVEALLPPSHNATTPSWRTLPIVRWRRRELRVDRVIDARTCIADGVVLVNVDNTAGGTIATAAADDGARGGRRGDRAAAALKDKGTMHAEAQRFVGLKVEFVASRKEAETSETAKAPDVITGVIESTFGKTGKVRLAFTTEVFAASGSAAGKQKSSGMDSAAAQEALFVRPGTISLPMKKYPLALHSRIHQ